MTQMATMEWTTEEEWLNRTAQEWLVWTADESIVIEDHSASVETRREWLEWLEETREEPREYWQADQMSDETEEEWMGVSIEEHRHGMYRRKPDSSLPTGAAS